jgi:hypothetical protein
VDLKSGVHMMKGGGGTVDEERDENTGSECESETDDRGDD